MKNLLLFALMTVCAIIPVSCLTTLQPLVTSVSITQDNRIKGNWQSDKGIITIETLANTKMMNKDDSGKSSMSWQRATHGQGSSYKKYDVLLDDDGVKRFMKNTTVFDGKKGIDGRLEPNSNVSDSIFFTKIYTISSVYGHKRHVMGGALTRIGDNLFLQLTPLLINDRETHGTGYEYTFDYHASFSIAKLNVETNKLSIEFLNGDYIKELINTGRIRIKHEKDNLFNSFVITASTEELRQFLEKYGDDERMYSKENTITLTRKG